MLFIGVDLGTSATKLLLVNEKGEILNTVTKEYPLSFPQPGWSEQDPGDWMKACMEGIPELLAGFDAKDVAALSVAGTTLTSEANVTSAKGEARNLAEAFGVGGVR